jgi:NADH dehydrogenase [ubiquinone] 1 alpha subcomplex assembly factor 1
VSPRSFLYVTLTVHSQASADPSRMNIILCITGLLIGAHIMADETIADFSKGETVDWRTVNDNVMGGRSVGDFEVGDKKLHFKGRTNTNGGGFSSIRASAQTLNLDGAKGFRLKLKGDGRKYTFRLRKRNSWVSYWSEFDTDDNEWQTVELKLEDFWPNWRGRKVYAPKIKGSQIGELGIMIYDGKDGAFSLDVASIVAYRENT